MPTSQDFSPTGLKIEGAYENDRNAEHADLFKQVLREAFGVTDVIIGHHLIYEKRDKRPDGFTYEVVQEIPSADALIFDHDIAARIFGQDGFRNVLAELAMTPVSERDKKYRGFVESRSEHTKALAAATRRTLDAAKAQAQGVEQ